jgi:hypothetical protein
LQEPSQSSPVTIITYYAIYLGQKIKKEDARGMTLTQEEYLKVNIQHQY